jgi:hypothetical protein
MQTYPPWHSAEGVVSGGGTTPGVAHSLVHFQGFSIFHQIFKIKQKNKKSHLSSSRLLITIFSLLHLIRFSIRSPHPF